MEFNNKSFEEKLKGMTKSAFGDGAEIKRTQEERQEEWDKRKAEESAKFDPENLEQTKLDLS